MKTLRQIEDLQNGRFFFFELYIASCGRKITETIEKEHSSNWKKFL